MNTESGVDHYARIPLPSLSLFLGVSIKQYYSNVPRYHPRYIHHGGYIALATPRRRSAVEHILSEWVISHGNARVQAPKTTVRFKLLFDLCGGEEAGGM